MHVAAYFHREIVGTEAEVISATKRRKLRAHVHLQVLEEVMILKTDEMDKIIVKMHDFMYVKHSPSKHPSENNVP